MPPIARSRARTVVAAALWLAGLGGCASSQPVDDLDLRLQAANHAFGAGYEYLLVKSSGAVADRAFINVSRATGPSELARELGQRLAPAAHGEAVRLLVTGPAGAKNVQIVADALASVEDRPLTSLELLYLGLPVDGESVRALVEEAGGRYRFAAFAD